MVAFLPPNWRRQEGLLSDSASVTDGLKGIGEAPSAEAAEQALNDFERGAFKKRRSPAMQLIALISLPSRLLLRSTMAAITIRNLDDTLKARLRLQAARHGRSMEEEARQLLSQGLSAAAAVQPVALAKTLFGPAHGVEELALPPRSAPRPLPEWAK